MNPSPSAGVSPISRMGALALALFLAGPLIGQEAPPESPESAVVRIRGTDVRDIEAMRQGPIVLVGIEEGGGAYRAGTPALERAKGQATLVNEDWLYERKLATFERGGIHHHPVPIQKRLPGASPIPRRPVAKLADRRVPIWFMTGLTMLVSCLAFFVWRSQQMQRVADEFGD